MPLGDLKEIKYLLSLLERMIKMVRDELDLYVGLESKKNVAMVNKFMDDAKLVTDGTLLVERTRIKEWVEINKFKDFEDVVLVEDLLKLLEDEQ